MKYFKSGAAKEKTVFQRLNEFLFLYLIERNQEKIISMATEDFFAAGLASGHVIKSRKELNEIWNLEKDGYVNVTDYEILDFAMVFRGALYAECFCTVQLRRKSAVIENGPCCFNITAGFQKEGDQYLLSLLFLSRPYLPEAFFEKIWGEYRTNLGLPDQSQYASQDLILSMLNDAARDPLTGVYNRRSGEALIQKALTGEITYVFLVLDIDHFKEINDIYGHQEGDRVLQYTVDLMQHSFRGSDIIFRLGGDEFVIFAYPCSDPEVLERKLRRINQQYQREMERNYKESGSSLSFGGVCGEGATSFQELYRRADRVLYEVKHSARQRQMIQKIKDISKS